LFPGVNRDDDDDTQKPKEKKNIPQLN
jgi:hypothetical protein